MSKMMLMKTLMLMLMMLRHFADMDDVGEDGDDNVDDDDVDEDGDEDVDDEDIDEEGDEDADCERILMMPLSLSDPSTFTSRSTSATTLNTEH